MSDADRAGEQSQSVKATLASGWRAAAELADPSLEERVGNLISNLERAFLPTGAGGLGVAIPAAMGPMEKLRLQYAIGLSHICQFLACAGASLDTLNHFGRLGTALADLNSAAMHPILSPPRFSGRVPDQTHMWSMRARAAVGLEFLIRSGLKRRDAAKRAAREAPELRRLLRAGKRPKDIERPTRPGRDDDLASSILKWRDALEGRTHQGAPVGTAMADVVATHIYESGKALLAKYEDTSHILRSGVDLLKWVGADAKAMRFDKDKP
jgi:hypothetical protein